MPALRPVAVTHCLGCGRRIHAPSEESFARQKLRHLRNCPAKADMRGQLVPLEELPLTVAAKLVSLAPPRTFWQRFATLLRAIARAVWR